MKTKADPHRKPERSVDEVVRDLEFDIHFGALKPRERLVEDDLMRRFDVKRHVIRNALAELERIGIVVKVPNRGAMVRDFDAREVEEISEIRAVLQSRAAERMELPAAAQLIDALEAAQREHDEAVRLREPRAIDKANEHFHDLLFGACGNAHLAEAIQRYAFLSRAMRLYPLVEVSLLETLRSEHWAMIEALRRGDRPTLKRLVVDHIQHSKKIYLDVRHAMSQRLAG
ncbi:MAG: GntR family transcriptional regulator [Xanthobacteraceae bacterium]